MINISWSPLATFRQQRSNEIEAELTILFLLWKLEPKAGVPHYQMKLLSLEIGNSWVYPRNGTAGAPTEDWWLKKHSVTIKVTLPVRLRLQKCLWYHVY